MIDLTLLLDSKISEKNTYVDYVLGNYYNLDELYNRLDELYNTKMKRLYLKCNTNHLRHLVDLDIIPIEENNVTKEVTFGTYVENKDKVQEFLDKLNIPAIVVSIAVFDFVHIYKELTGQYPSIIKSLPAKDFFSVYVNEGYKLGASDMTMYSSKDGYVVDYKINKRTKRSNIKLPIMDLDEVVDYLVTNNQCTRSKSSKNKVIYLTDDYSKSIRLRTAINFTYFGYEITCRYLSKEITNTNINSLNLPEQFIEFINKSIVKKSVGGLNVICGPTSSGKNTTIIATLKEIISEIPQKIVSVENPVEIILDGLIQIEAKDEDEFIESIRSLIRQDPDYVYITEITDTTCKETLKIANTGKAILSSVHSNSCADTISRLIDLAIDFNSNDVIRLLNCIIHQQLVPRKCSICNDEGCPDCYKSGVIPVVSGVFFSKELKSKLLDLSNNEIIKLIEDNTIYFNDLSELLNKNIISEKTYRRLKYE